MLRTETSEAEEDETEDEELEEQPAEEPTTQIKPVVPSVEAQLAPPRVRKVDFVGRRNWYFAFSLLIIIPGIFFMAHSGFKLGIDFAGGTEFTVSFPASRVKRRSKPRWPQRTRAALSSPQVAAATSSARFHSHPLSRKASRTT